MELLSSVVVVVVVAYEQAVAGYAAKETRPSWTEHVL